MSKQTQVMTVHGAVLSRRQFVKTGGALVVGVGMAGTDLLTASVAAQTRAGRPDPSLVRSWFEIHADNTLTVFTGKTDFGQGAVPVAFKQIIADELYVPFDAITSMVMGDTDRTPDGGVSAGYLGLGAPNLKKAAAYTREALLELGATHLGVARNQVTVKDGVISGGGRSVRYGELVAKQQLTLKIPVAGDPATLYGLVVTGNPPMKPVSEYTVIGKSHTNFITASKVAAKETWATDVKLPNMLHGRVIHPKTLGSTLVSAGAVDRKQYPNAQVIVRGNLVGVVAPTEWEAVRAAQQVAGATTWSDWKGLPGHEHVHAWLRQNGDWKTAPVAKGSHNRGDVSALATGAKKLTATYEMPYLKHAPIGPAITVADAKADGQIAVYTHNQNPSVLRAQLAQMLGTPADNIVVRSVAGAGHYGRSNGGNVGGECEAVLLSKSVGQPVRLQWTRQDDLQWSTSSPCAYTNVQLALDAEGNIAAAQFDNYMPAMQDDRLIGAVLAGLPTLKAPDVDNKQPGGVQTIVNTVFDTWFYDRVQNLAQWGHGTYQVGQKASPISVGIRDHSLRTPWQIQQHFPRELAISEAAALAGADPVEYRLRHTTDARLIAVLNAARTSHGWQARPSPRPNAAAAGAQVAKGRGVSVMERVGTYWACICDVSVDRQTGKITIDKVTMSLDPGIVINPFQTKRQVEGGILMGISHTLYEEMRFDESGITSRDWRTYPIATMADVPVLDVVIVSSPGATTYGGVSEAANTLPLSAIAAAFFDATGKVPRRLPLAPQYVQSLLKA